VTAGAALGAPLAAYDVGRRYEDTLSDAARRDGAHYTPPDVAEGLVARTLELVATDGPLRCWDPACGGGAFLVALAEAVHRRGVPTDRVLGDCVVGTDVDPGAVAASRRALEAWAAERGGSVVPPHVEVADGLDVDLGPLDVVVGNPPFRSQLGADTARDAATSSRRRARFGSAAGGYVDDAVLFLLAGARALRPGGVLCLIQPRSTLAAAHAATARSEVVADGRRLVAAWFPGERVFGADVDVWAPFVAHDGGGGRRPVRRFTGRRALAEAPPLAAVADDGWGSLAAAGEGVPEVDGWRTVGTLGDVADATAGFRDEYYGLLAAMVADEPPGGGLRAVTSGLVDPGRCDWGRRPTTIGKVRWEHPWVDRGALAALHPRVARWAERLAVPKVLVATQTKVVEAVADPVGDLVPVTPVIAVVPGRSDLSLGELVVALCSPPVAAWAQRRRGGTGLSPAAVRLSAGDLAAVPLPADRARWRQAAGLLAAGAPWSDVAAAASAAYGLDDGDLVEWWASRLPRRVGASAAAAPVEPD
jgi:hypothetical protein